MDWCWKKGKETSVVTLLDVRQEVRWALSRPAVLNGKRVISLELRRQEGNLLPPQLFEAPLAPFPLPHPHPLHNEETQQCISPLSLRSPCGERNDGDGK